MPEYTVSEKVHCNSPQGRVQGTIIKKVTSDNEYESLSITTSHDDPRYVVKSYSTGKLAAHKGDSLSKQ